MKTFLFTFLFCFSLEASRIKIYQERINLAVDNLFEFAVAEFYSSCLKNRYHEQAQGLIKKIEKLEEATKGFGTDPRIMSLVKMNSQLLGYMRQLVESEKKNSKIVFNIWKQIFNLAQTFRTKKYAFFYCNVDRSVWIQKKRTPAQNPVRLRKCVSKKIF